MNVLKSLDIRNAKMNIYFDIGNSNIKINICKNNKDNIIKIPTNELHSFKELSKLILNFVNKNVDQVLISSVVPKKEKIIVNFVKKFLKIEPFILGKNLKPALIAQSNSKNMGADLFALASFVASKTDNGIIVNLGSAITITHVKNKKIMGTIISIGINSSLELLSKKIDKINEITFKPTKKLIGNTTSEAVYLGIVKGNAKLISSLVSEIDDTAKVFVSGGDYRFVQKFLSKYIFIQEATLKGLKIIGKLNKL